jgi:hypothetical protein
MPDINDQNERRHTKLNEITSTVGQVFLGLTIQCAQCHDHKFDPISQADFYRMRAIFEGAVPVLKRAKLMNTHISSTKSKPGPSYLMIRGDFRKQGPKVNPGFIRVINEDAKDGTRLVEFETLDKVDGRRSALAGWLTRAKTPAAVLVARVIVNRVWQRYFGKGFVPTSGDLGFMGDLPSHPKLLDWMALDFIEQGWSLKKLHRLILMSAAYQQASKLVDTRSDLKAGPKDKQRWELCKKTDPGNRLLWRMNVKRLTGEAIRDSMLLVAGKLDLTIGGPSVRPELPKEVLSTLLRLDHWKTSKKESDRNRRSIYVFARRNLIYPMFTVFDRPDAQQCASSRGRSTTPVSALMMMNSAFSIRLSREFAGILINDNPDDESKRTEQAFLRAIGRPPNAQERKVVLDFFKLHSDQLRKSGRPGKDLALPLGMDEKVAKKIDPYRAAAWKDLCLLLYNLNEFIYVD